MEAKYKPYLLEFGALKASLDKFSDTVWGMPLEIETDCKALRDVLLMEKPSATHARWRDGVLAYNIVAVHHVPGVTNIADGISRQYEGTEKGGSDGSGWSVSPDVDTVLGVVQDVFQLATSIEELDLCECFKDEHIFLEVIDAILELDRGTKLRDRIRARHRAKMYAIEDGKLWHIGGGVTARACDRREVVTKAEAVELARKEHEGKGYWHRDSIKITLMNRYHSAKLDESIVKAITSCGRCQNFGGAHLHALLKPITRRHPFNLLVGDYLSLPKGKGGYHTVGLYLDTTSQHVWGYKFKTYGTGKTTCRSLEDIAHNFVPPETFMSDNGPHFKNDEVRETCTRLGIKSQFIAAYSPWVNGLVKGTNKLLLYVLARLCAPDLGESSWDEMCQGFRPF